MTVDLPELRRWIRGVRVVDLSGASNVESLSSGLGTPATTIHRHVDLLEMLFLVRRLPAWSNNLLARTFKRPKVHVADTGLLALPTAINERSTS